MAIFIRRISIIRKFLAQKYIKSVWTQAAHALTAMELKVTEAAFFAAQAVQEILPPAGIYPWRSRFCRQNALCLQK